MALTKAKKAKLRAEGMKPADIERLEAILDADEGDADNGSKPSGSRRVVVYEGDDAESFMRDMFKGSDSGDEGETETEDEGDEGDDDHEGDEPPKGKTKWFG